MNEINKTLFIPLYGKAQLSRKNVILKDKKAEEIWEKEAFPIKGAAKFKWLAYFMSMRARVFDDWTDRMLKENPDALVLHIGCGLDSRCLRVKEKYIHWLDGDFPDIISLRRHYFEITESYDMFAIDASKAEGITELPDSSDVIVILEGISMYLSNEELKALFCHLQEKYAVVHILVDVYTEFGIKASKYKNPVKGLGVTKLYGVEDMEQFLSKTKIRVKSEHCMTPASLINELRGFDKIFIKTVFAGRMAGKIYRIFKLEKT